MTHPMSDQDVAARVLHHIDRGTTDLGDAVWREPLANYTSPERLRREVEQVIGRSLVPFCPSATLPETGSYVSRHAAGIPVVAVRAPDGAVRAFVNVCRHRGMALAQGSGCAKVFVCGYHGWAYGLDGRLQHVPHEHGFPGLDKALHGLVEVHCAEHGGLVCVAPALKVSESVRPECTELPELIAPGQQLMSASERDTPANWKIVLEGFIEGYHIKPTHPQSFLPYGYDNLNVVETFGANSRVTYPFRRIEKLRNVPEQERRVAGLLTYVYQLFPNALLTVLSSHTNLVVLEPIAVDRTRVFTWVLANAGDDPAAAKAAAAKDAAFVGNTGAAEDRAVVTAIQQGVNSGANDAFTFGRFEAAIVHFHRELDAALAAA